MFLLFDRNDGSASELTESKPPIASRILYGLAAIACLICVALSATGARADWLRREPTALHIAEAIRLDPSNPDAYTLKAELLERGGQFEQAEQCWRQATQRNRHDSEAWTRIALLEERRGALDRSELSLLHAASLSHMWLPRWALVNFYARHGRTAKCYEWSRKALERASEDVNGLFAVVQNAGATAIQVEDMLPRNRQVHAAWLAYELMNSGANPDLDESAAGLAALIPQTVPGWPGIDIASWRDRTFPATDQERALLLAVIDRDLADGKGVEAGRLWNVLVKRKIILGEPWTARNALVNARFRFDSCKGGLEWRYSGSDHVETLLAPEAGEFTVHLDGHQPESVELLRQRTYVPPGISYQFTVESRTDGVPDDGSLTWQVVDRSGKTLAGMRVRPSEDWRSEMTDLGPATDGRVVDAVLTCKRPAGSVRAEGSARFRLVALRSSY